MRAITAGVLCGLLLLGSVAWAAEGDLSVGGGGTVPQPGEGFTWQLAKEGEEEPGTKVQIFIATKEGSTARVVLIATQRAVAGDKEKIARLKANFNGMLEGLRAQGHTLTKSTKPPLDAPLPSRVNWGFVGTDKDKKPAYLHGVMLFGKSIYLFQVSAGSEEEAAKLAKVADAVKGN